MLFALPAFLRPSTLLHALEANLSTEPKVLFVYAILLVIPWVVWQGLRTGDPDPPHAGGEPEEDAPAARGAEPPTERRKRRVREKGSSPRRRRGGINWIQ